MDFDWFFRRGQHGSEGSDFFSDNEDHNFGNKRRDEEMGSFDGPFIDPFGNIEGTSHNMFKRMDEMLSQMFASSFTPFGSIRFEDGISKENDPRSMLLKDPGYKNWEQYPPLDSLEVVKPDQLVDNDIDNEVAKHGLLIEDRPQAHDAFHNFSYKKFSSTRTILLPNGTVEEHRKFTDNQGNVTTTVRRSIGDQSYEVTTHADGQGIKEKQENLTNLDENELIDFEKRWQDLKTGKTELPKPPSESLVPKLTPSPGDPSYLSLFKKFFGL